MGPAVHRRRMRVSRHKMENENEQGFHYKGGQTPEQVGQTNNRSLSSEIFKNLTGQGSKQLGLTGSGGQTRSYLEFQSTMILRVQI